MDATKKCEFCEQDFLITAEDLVFYDKIGVPPPRLCPDDRQRRRAAFRNERNLYSRQCDATGKKIVSMYSPASPFTVYDQEYFWGDAWSAIDYGQEFDFSRPFFEQFRELQLKVPRLSLYNVNSQNSYYTNHSADNKNCYMSVDLGGCEDVYFSNWMTGSRDCIDCSYSHDCELCYEALYCTNCYNCDFCQNCEQCNDCVYCYDCQNCKNCFGCAGLRGQEYFLFNERVSPDTFRSFLEDYQHSRSKQQGARVKFEETKASVPHRFAYVIQSENAEGDYLYNCKNVRASFDGVRLWDCKFMYESLDCKDAYDCYQPGWVDSELVYEIHAGQGLTRSKFLHLCRNVSESHYCDNCFYSNDLFGCVSLNRKSHCILNKQYSESEYRELLPRVIEHAKETGEYGEFFPFACSPFGYNESRAQDFYPLFREEALSRGLLWNDVEPAIPSGDTVDPADDIREIGDDITSQVIRCAATERPFKVIEQELVFYRKKKLPLRDLHPDERYRRRVAARNPRHLWTHDCAQCAQQVESTYSPETQYQVYCEQCYLASRY